MQLIVNKESAILDYIQTELKIKAKTKVRLWLKSNQVCVNGIVVKKADQKLSIGDKIEIGKFSGDHKAKIPAWFKIYFEDEHLLVAHKPAGILTIDVTGKTHKTFFHEVSKYVRENNEKAKKIYLVHRLDLEVEGLLIFAKTAKVQTALKDDWTNTEKIYYALVEGCPKEESGTIESFLHEDEDRKVYSGPRTTTAKHAITHFNCIKKINEDFTLVQVMLGTGRKNQIRVHLSEMGHPIVGDYRYGADNKIKRQIRLMACSLEFTHPIKQERLKLKIEPSKKFMNPSHYDETY